ncbi:MAG: hypothetical protein J7K83_00330 [Candidatus Aenigmarchaeota archaeon]|nr:hypothetical protein [Candidatus Aenigmarchaeota archaeon]
MYVGTVSFDKSEFNKEIEMIMYDLVIENIHPDTFWLNFGTWLSLGWRIYFDENDMKLAKEIMDTYSKKVKKFDTYDEIEQYYANSLYLTVRDFFNIDGFDLLWRFYDILERRGPKIAAMFYDKEVQQFLWRYNSTLSYPKDDFLTRVKIVFDRMATHLIAAGYLHESFVSISHAVSRKLPDDEMELIDMKSDVWYLHLKSQDYPGRNYLNIKSYNLVYYFDEGYDIKDAMKIVLYSLLPHTIFPNQYPKYIWLDSVKEVLIRRHLNDEKEVSIENAFGFRNMKFVFDENKIIFKSRNKPGMPALFSEVVISSQLAVKETNTKKVDILCSKKNSKSYTKVV